MTVILTLTTAGSDSGPFDLYSNTNGYVTAFEIGVAKSALEGGYTTSLVPDGTTIVKVQSTGNCKTSVNIILTGGTTTTTTTTPGIPCDSYEMVGVSDSPGCPFYVNYTYTDCDGVVQTGGSFSYLGTETVCAQSPPTITCGSASISNLGPCVP